MADAGDISDKTFGLRQTIVPLAFFTLFFIINFVIGYAALQNIAVNQDQASQSLENINYLNAFHLAIINSESSQRGFLLTDLAEYSELYESSLVAIGERQRDMAENAVFGQQQEARAAMLYKLANEKIDEMQATLYAVLSAPNVEAVQLIFSERNRDLMTEITELAVDMEAIERDMLDMRSADVAESRVLAFYLILTSNIVGLLMVFISLSLIRKSASKDAEYARSLQEANDNLEEKVRERTEALEHFSNELKRSNRELQDFAFVASHDLQEPLRKIRAFGDRLSASYGKELGEKGTDYIRRMYNASERMSVLINDLLSFSRITTKAKPFVDVNLNRVLEEVLEDLEIAVEESQATISHDPLPVIHADFLQIKQLFQNLIGNAIKFRAADRSPQITISVEYDTELPLPSGHTRASGMEVDDGEDEPEAPQMVQITFTDNGVGFDEQYAERIFMPFQRLHGKELYQGTGIGLSICRRIVERHGGSISASSREGQGSRFTITLPLYRKSFDLSELDVGGENEPVNPQ